MPGLDGLRAIAVVAVILYHLDPAWLPGGLLGVGMFFTLSGYLITWILVRTWDRLGGLDLRNFWIRRARRLLPAVVLLLAVVVATTAAVDLADLGTRVRESLAALFYVFNWTTIASDVSYFERFAGPGPFDHLWSLAVEEQFYLLWPLLLLGLLKLFRGRMTRVAATTMALAALSFVWMTVLAQPGFDATRVYEGTDTRAGGLLVGAAVAMIWRPDRITADITPRARAIVDGLGIVALATILGLFVFIDPWGQVLYDGGLLLLSIATVVLVGVVVHPASRLARAMGLAPLVWVGERSYGIYLWHLPVIVFTPASVLAGAPLVRAGLQVTVSFVLAALSWRLVEDPIRRHGMGVLADRPVIVRPSWWRWPKAPVARRAVVLGAAATVTLSSVALAGGSSTGPDPDSGIAAQAESTIDPDPSPSDPDPGDAAATPDEPAESAPADDGPSATPESAQTPAPAAPASDDGSSTSACTSVVHVGDSTSLGLDDVAYLPDEDDQIPARYAEVGAEEVITQIDGAMSIVERFKDRPNATMRVSQLVEDGQDGCWVLAMGTNEAANEAVGGGIPFDERIAMLMEEVDGQPTMWTTTRSLEDTGPYADQEMAAWSEAVVAACETWPNLRVYDWRSEVRDDWFIDDQIHYTSEGYRNRAERLAQALARAWPADGDPMSDCLVSSGLDEE
nr:acyltransferase family protein [Salsipaludibacter albus]